MMRTRGERTGRSGRAKEIPHALRPADVWRESKEILWDRRGALAIGMFLMVVSRVASLVLPASTKWVIDDVIGKGQTHLLIPIAVAAGIATLIQAGSGFALSQILGVTAQFSITEMRKNVHRHLVHLPTKYFDSTKTGILISRVMSDAEGLRNLVGNGFVQLVGGTMTALMAMAVLFWVNWRLTLVMLVTIVLFGSMMSFAFNKIRPIFRERSIINAEVTGRLAESIGGIRVVKSYVAERKEERVFARGVHSLLRNVAKTITAISAVSAGATVLFGGTAIVMMVLGSHAIMNGTMTLGDMGMYVMFTGLAARPIMQIAQIGTQITEAFAGLDRIREVKNEQTERDADGDRTPLDGIRGDIEFQNVSFEYEESRPVLRDISFVAPAGTTTALVGPSGSGKSTLIGLVMTFNDPSEGSVLLDGKDLKTVRLQDYRSHLGVVLQDNFLFDGTVLENIRYSRPTATLDEVREVARIAHVDEFVDPLEQGYDSIIGERGIKLSGGQRQRIAIARAILANPSILILDEATSSLDSESEAKIQDGLQTLRRGRTTFVIAHRLSTIRSADQILVLEEGRIVERGTHPELMALGGRYRQLHDKQYKVEMDRFVNPGEEWGERTTTETVVAPVGRPEDL